MKSSLFFIVAFAAFLQVNSLDPEGVSEYQPDIITVEATSPVTDIRSEDKLDSEGVSEDQPDVTTATAAVPDIWSEVKRIEPVEIMDSLEDKISMDCNPTEDDQDPCLSECKKLNALYSFSSCVDNMCTCSLISNTFTW